MTPTEYARHWRKMNPEKSRALSKRWAQANKEKLREAKRRYYKANREAINARRRRWAAANTPRVLAQNARRRARERFAAVPLTREERARVLAVYERAARVSRKTGIVHHVDHDRPLARGGKHHPDNLIVLPADMNAAKGSKYDSTWDFICS